MKFALAIIVLLVFAVSFLADYKWRQWMARRRAEHDSPQARNSGHPLQ